MKTQEFKEMLRADIEKICANEGWSVDDRKQRGMAFENWCFDLFQERYPAADNEAEDSIIRVDDFNIDVCFPSRDTDEIHLLQCKHPKIGAINPINENYVDSFFSRYGQLRDGTFRDDYPTKNLKILDIFNEFKHWREKPYHIYMTFISNGRSSEKLEVLTSKYNSDYSKDLVTFEIWDFDRLRDEYASQKSIEETYPEAVHFTLAKGSFLEHDGPQKNLTFILKGKQIQQPAIQHKDRLFNWNIRRDLGKKGQVNTGLRDTIINAPKNFFYFNNGISALCENYEFDRQTRELKITRLQIVNGAQTLGAIRNSKEEDLKDLRVLVKLTAVKDAGGEKGFTAQLIKTNNTQNALKGHDFRANDKIQIWLENEFRETKSRGELGKVDYGRKRPHPKKRRGRSVLQMQDFGKIRYAWPHEPRVAYADPKKLSDLKEDGGLYDSAFGVDGEIADIWLPHEFKTALLALHSYNKIVEMLVKCQKDFPCYENIFRWKFYGLSLFQKYIERDLVEFQGIEESDLFDFGDKYNTVFDKGARKIILEALKETYKSWFSGEEGRAFSLPRDEGIWKMALEIFERNSNLLRADSPK